MHTPPLIADLAVILVTAGIVTFLFRKMRQPVVLGYIVAGMIVGPFTPPYGFVKDLPNITTWSELGVIFLMFALGLEFTFHKLTKVGTPATGTAIVEVVSMIALGFGSGHLLGWKSIDSLFLGGMLAISSTTIIIKALEELKMKTRKFSDVVFGVLIVEDLFAILILVALSTISAQGEIDSRTLVLSGLKLLFVVGSWFVVGYFFIPSFLRYAGKHMDDEALTVLATGLCLGLVVVAGYFHYSAALGAFIMGSILAETQQSHRIEVLIRPVKSLFAAVFFVSVGMLVDPRQVIDHWPAVAFLTFITIVGKIISSSLGALATGQPVRSSIQIGMSLAQIGEFSFIIAALGATLKVTSDFLYPVAVAVSVITTFTTPYLIKISERAGALFEARLPLVVRRGLERYSENVAHSTAGDRRISLGQVMQFLANGIATGLVFLLISKFGMPWFAEKFPNFSQVDLLAWGTAIILSAPFVWGMFFAFRKVPIPRGHFPWADLLLGRLGTITWLGIVSELFLKTTTAIIGLLFGMGLLFIAFYRRLEISYRWFERRFVSNLQQGGENESEKMLTSLAPWDLHLVRVVVHPNATLAGHSLGQLDVRHKYGLNIVVIQRGDRVIAPPQATDALLPGDTLLVLGTDEQIERFNEVVAAPSAEVTDRKALHEYSLRKMVIRDGSPLLNQTIRESKIREQMASLVVGLERGGERILNPQPSLEIKQGDVLWLVGGLG